MGAASKRAKRIRSAAEFDVSRLEVMLKQPRDGQNTIDAWSLQEIYVTREMQMLGDFVRPSRMVEAFRTDDALFTAHRNRLAPLPLIPVKVASAGGSRADSIAAEADALYGPDGVAISAGTINNIHSCLVNHGVAFASCIATPRADGSRVDLEAHYWPIEYIRWDPVFRVFKARADPNTVQPGDIPAEPWNEYGFVGGYWIPVIHGDGRWIIFSDYENLPFRNDAALLPAALVWARHAFGNKDWAKGSKAHGSAKVIGELPAGVALQNSEGLTPEAAAFVSLLRSIATEDSPVGIRPAGAKTEFVTNTSTAWQVWAELVKNAERAADRIYLGTDGISTTQGTEAPGVNLESLFGVADTKLHADTRVISRGINTGLIEPWCAMNFGDSKLAPRRKYLLPNNDEQEIADDYATRNDAFFKALVDAKSAGLMLTPAYIQALATDYKVRVPELAATPAPQPTGVHSGSTSAPNAP